MFDVTAMDAPASVEKMDLPGGVNLDLLEIAELLELRSAIQARLPLTLQELNLENELVLQYQEAKTLINRTSNSDAAANQKAQVLNTCMAVLQQLGKLQQQLYNAERFKAIEHALIRAVRTMPVEAQAKFFADYEKLYGSTTQNEETDDGSKITV